MNGPHPGKYDKRADRLRATVDFAVAVLTLVGLACVSACVLGLAQDTLLDNALVQGVIDNWTDRVNNTLRVLAVGVRYMTGGK